MIHDDFNTHIDGSYPERRGEKRLIKRLKWGKILSIRNEFISECQIANQTSAGARLRVIKLVYIPRLFILFDDNTEALLEGEVIWRNGMELGCKLSAQPPKARCVIARRMCSRFYGL